MATLDDNVKSLVEKSYPQAKGGEDDPVKLSSTIFSDGDVSISRSSDLVQTPNAN